MKTKLVLSLFLATTLVVGETAVVAAADPAYPSLDAKQLGALRNTVTLAQQADNDWTDMDLGPRSTFDALQFQLAWMHYGLAVAQSQLTPAYRELYKEASVGIIDKMLLNTTWEFWHQMLQQPRFSKYVKPGEDFRDPVKDKNIMYSGHLLQMIGLHVRLYKDDRYEQPGSIKFSQAGSGVKAAGLSGAGFSNSYNHHELAKIIHDQFVESQFIGIECEPNFVFAECNQHPILGLIDYDKKYGTKLADVKEAFWEKAGELGFINQESRFAGPYVIKESVTMNNPSVWNDAWTGITLHAWNKDVVNEVYPAQRDAVLSEFLSTSPDVVKRRWAMQSVSSDFGYLASYAAEVGDQATRKALLDYADNNLNPVWKDGRYFYPRHDVSLPEPAQAITGSENPSERPVVLLPDDKLDERMVNRLAGNALLTFARLNEGNGLYNLYNRFDASYVVDGPEIVGVDYPRVLVDQAYFDQSKRVLAINILPGTDYKDKVAFRIHNLPQTASYEVMVDGVLKASVAGTRISRKGSDVALKWDAAGDLNVELPLQDGRAILVKQVSGTL